MTNRGSALSNLNLISTWSVVFATLTKSDASLQKPLREIMQLRSHFELVSFPLTGRKLIEVVIKAGGESLESSWERRFLAVKSLIQWEYPHTESLVSERLSPQTSPFSMRRRAFTSTLCKMFRFWSEFSTASLKEEQSKTPWPETELIKKELLWLLQVTSLECYCWNGGNQRQEVMPLQEGSWSFN